MTKQLNEAKRRLHELGVADAMISDFVKNGVIPVCRESTFITPTEKMTSYCSLLKERDGVLPYYFVYYPNHGYFSWIILVVSENPSEWDNELCLAGTDVVAYSYIGSLTQEGYEPGDIKLVNDRGLLTYRPFSDLKKLFELVPCPLRGSNVSM